MLAPFIEEALWKDEQFIYIADDRTGDHVAIFEAGEISGHTAGVLVVRAVIIRCDDKTCDSSTELPGAVDFPQTVQDGVPFTLRLIWDKANNQFLAALGAQTDQALPYAASDSAPAASPIAALGLQIKPRNCTAGVQQADITAAVRRVRTNVSAIIP